MLPEAPSFIIDNVNEEESNDEMSFTKSWEVPSGQYIAQVNSVNPTPMRDGSDHPYHMINLNILEGQFEGTWLPEMIYAAPDANDPSYNDNWEIKHKSSRRRVRMLAQACGLNQVNTLDDFAGSIVIVEWDVQPSKKDPSKSFGHWKSIRPYNAGAQSSAQRGNQTIQPQAAATAPPQQPAQQPVGAEVWS